MATFKTIKFIAGLALLALSSLMAPASAEEAVNFAAAAFIAPAGSTSIPIGHAEFCAAQAGECGINTHVEEATVLTEAGWQQLTRVNSAVNAAITPVTDLDLYQVDEFWTYPRSAGDCEDFVLAKRRELIALGWNPSTLLITVVREASGSGHAVLLVRTDRGDLVLDNQTGLVRLWNETPYQFVKRQSQTHSGQWVDLVDPRPMTLIASL